MHRSNHQLSEGLDDANAERRQLRAKPFVLQATTFLMYGRLVNKPGTIRDAGGVKPQWPIYTAYVYNSDGSVYDFRSAYNDFELALWLESFGFGEVRNYMDTVLA